MRSFHNISSKQKSNATRDFTSFVGGNGVAFPLKRVAHEILEINFRTLGSSDLYDAEAVGAALIAAARKEALRRSPLKQILGWDSQGPTRVNGSGVFDHRYMLHDKKHQTKLYVSEPYELTAGAIQDLLAFQCQGWVIEVKAGGALHFPGATLAISFEREENP